MNLVNKYTGNGLTYSANKKKTKKKILMKNLRVNDSGTYNLNFPLFSFLQYVERIKKIKTMTKKKRKLN